MSAMSTLVQLAHTDPDLYAKGSDAVERGDPLLIRVTGPAVHTVTQANHWFDAYMRQKAQGRKNRLLLLKFGWYGVRIASLWGVLNAAELRGAEVLMTRDGPALLITIIRAEEAA